MIDYSILPDEAESHQDVVTFAPLLPDVVYPQFSDLFLFLPVPAGLDLLEKTAGAVLHGPPRAEADLFRRLYVPAL